MNKKLYQWATPAALSLALLASVSSMAQAPTSSQLWLDRFGSATDNDAATSVVTDAAGNVYVTGAAGPLGYSDIVTVKYSPTGQQLWTQTWNSSLGYRDAPLAMVLRGGALYITGYTDVGQFPVNSSYNLPPRDFVTLKYDLNGTLGWATTFHLNNLPNRENIAYAVDADAQGNVSVTGSCRTAAPSTRPTIGYRDIVTLGYNSAGQLQWQAQYTAPGSGASDDDDIPVALRRDAAGNTYVTGSSINGSSPSGPGSGYDYATLKYGPIGTVLWEQRYAMPGNGADVPTALALDAAGNVYVTGSSSAYATNPALLDDIATLKYAPSGTLLWTRRFDSGITGVRNNEAANDLALDAAGNVYVTGFGPGQPGTFGDDYLTLKYDAAGTLLWQSRWDGQGFEDRALRLALDGAGNPCITGTRRDPQGTDDYGTISLDQATGQLRWTQRYNGPGNAGDRPAAIAFDPAGNVVVTGTSQDVGSTDFATLKYSGAVAAPLAQRPALTITEMTAYPNPARERATLTFAQPLALLGQVSLYDATGRRCATFAVPAGQARLEIDTRSLLPGVYLLRPEGSAGRSGGQRLVIQP